MSGQFPPGGPGRGGFQVKSRLTKDPSRSGFPQPPNLHLFEQKGGESSAFPDKLKLYSGETAPRCRHLRSKVLRVLLA